MKPPKSLEQFAKIHGLHIRKVKYHFITGGFLVGWDLVNDGNYIQLSLQPTTQKRSIVYPETWKLTDERQGHGITYLRTIREILKYEFTPAETTCMKWNDDFSI